MTTALYRRYRPETFAEVIGQEHVTGPLMQALRSGRVNHAYLFSGPRGCGKTTSARILARTLNCHANTPETPIDTPCGVCPSCVELARGGSGSLDVVEIDAASHGGVDDARDLRERATFAPARDRYKIFIIDEAHMVSSAGFNALLKIVEEPPPHIKFVFATTEPDKVIGTIRSRTHHYPFRLVPPDVLAPYLESLCAPEGVTLGGGVIPLVVRAGGGSVRDSLSVLDQLIAGASGTVVDYDLAVGLLGYTHSSLLDDVVDALAARDGASLFRVVDQLIASGHAPQRFVDDLLERLRDLIVIAVSGDAAAAVLREQPADQLERMGGQASRLGVGELSRAADLVNAALTEMTGATSPRLHLELLCARLLLPGADEGAAGLAARVERLERGGLTAATSGTASVRAAPAADDVAAPQTGATAGGLSGAAAARAALHASRRPASPGQEAVTAPADEGPGAAPVPRTAAPAVSVPAPASAAVIDVPQPEEPPVDDEPPPPSAAPAPVVPPAAPSGVTVTATEPTAELVRRRWDEVLANLAHPNARAFFGENAQIVGLDAGVLRLGFPTQNLAEWSDTPERRKTVEDAVYETLGVPVRIEVVVGTGGRPREAGATRHPRADQAESDDPAPAASDDPAPAASDDRAPAPRPTVPVTTAPAVLPAAHEPVPAAGRESAPGGPPSPGADRTPAPAANPSADQAIDDADAAWLAGVSLHEPPADDEPEPPADDEPAAASAAASAPLARPGVSRRESPLEAVQRHALQARAQSGGPTSAGTSASSGLDPYDDAATDDPEITSSGLVGVPLAVKILNGTIVDERLDNQADH